MQTARLKQLAASRETAANETGEGRGWDEVTDFREKASRRAIYSALQLDYK